GLLLDDQRIGLELLAGQSCELILVPHRLIVERKMRCTMGHRNSEKIRMFERPDLCIERVAYQAQPGNSDVDTVPGPAWPRACMRALLSMLRDPIALDGLGSSAQS